MTSTAALERRRREMAAAYAQAARRHQPRAALARNLVAITCQVLKSEIRAARAAGRRPSPQTDLFLIPEPPHETHRQPG